VENPYQSPAAEPPPLPVPSAQGLQPVYPFAAAALWMFAGSIGLAAVDHVARMVSVPESASLHDTYYVEGLTFFEWVLLALSLGSVVPYLIWKYRVTWNATRLDPAGMTLSPAMAVGSYFIPFVNLYLPCKAMAQVAKASTGTTRGVAIWWGTQLGSALFGFAIGIIQSSATPLRPGWLDHLYIVVSVLTLVAAWKLIMSITRAQMASRQDAA
jgi:hypothetical protein